MRLSLDCRPAVGAFWPPKARVVGKALVTDESRGSPCNVISTERLVESFADDLNTRRGIVSGRVALLPRSAEIQPHVARIRPSPHNQPQHLAAPTRPEVRAPRDANTPPKGPAALPGTQGAARLRHAPKAKYEYRRHPREELRHAADAKYRYPENYLV